MQGCVICSVRVHMTFNNCLLNSTSTIVPCYDCFDPWKISTLCAISIIWCTSYQHFVQYINIMYNLSILCTIYQHCVLSINTMYYLSTLRTIYQHSVLSINTAYYLSTLRTICQYYVQSINMVYNITFPIPLIIENCSKLLLHIDILGGSMMSRVLLSSPLSHPGHWRLMWKPTSILSIQCSLYILSPNH